MPDKSYSRALPQSTPQCVADDCIASVRLADGVNQSASSDRYNRCPITTDRYGRTTPDSSPWASPVMDCRARRAGCFALSSRLPVAGSAPPAELFCGFPIGSTTAPLTIPSLVRRRPGRARHPYVCCRPRLASSFWIGPVSRSSSIARCCQFLDHVRLRNLRLSTGSGRPASASLRQ